MFGDMPIKHWYDETPHETEGRVFPAGWDGRLFNVKTESMSYGALCQYFGDSGQYADCKNQ